MKQGAYFARVTGDQVFTVYADEDAVRDAQMHRIFADRDKTIADQQKVAAEKQRKADRQAFKKARKIRSMAKECLWLAATAVLTCCAHFGGAYAAVAVVTGCAAVIGCRVAHYITTKEE